VNVGVPSRTRGLHSIANLKTIYPKEFKPYAPERFLQASNQSKYRFQHSTYVKAAFLIKWILPDP
jgi:hypothetical protein